MEVLSPEAYDKAKSQLDTIPMNTLFAKSVVNHNVSGTIFVDDAISPGTFYIAHPYGMSLLFGDTNHPEFNNQLVRHITNCHQNRHKNEWLQVFPAKWSCRLEELLGTYLVKGAAQIENSGKVHEYTRVNFRFNINKYREMRKNLNLTPDYCIKTTNDYIFSHTYGNVVPRYFWDNAKDFTDRATAYSLVYKDKIVATAFSSFQVEHYLEIGIETLENYRGKGLASYVCSLLIDYCLENGFEPVWACRADNMGSYRLALCLGFEPWLTIPYYKLVVSYIRAKSSD